MLRSMTRGLKFLKETLKSVQGLFIAIDKITEKYRLKTKAKKIIDWILYKLEPVSVRKVVRGILNQDNPESERAGKSLKAFHDLLMGIAKTFAESAALGLTPTAGKTKSEDKKPPGKKDGKKQGGKYKSKKGDGDKKPNQDKQPPKKVKWGCLNCGKQDHALKDCPTIPPERKGWEMKKWWSWAKAGRGQSKIPASGPKDGRGGQPRPGNKKRLGTTVKSPAAEVSAAGARERETVDTPGVFFKKRKRLSRR